jgi:predicted ATPase with chaperone activity
MLEPSGSPDLPTSLAPRWPTIPDRVEDLGIPRAVVADLVLRYLWLHGSASLEVLHGVLKLSYQILEALFHQFRQQQLLEVKGMLGNDYSFSLTSAGRALASTRTEVCQYIGPAPVSIQDYQAMVKSQAAKLKLNRESLREAFSDLVLTDSMLDQLGPSLVAHQSLFLYGSTGNGKTSIAERILRCYHDRVLIPYAIEVDGHIVLLYDPVVHHASPHSDERNDPRWVECERPCLTVGGELSAAMLELRLDESTRVFIAPAQLKANNGILIIDDFGRQMLSPRELLNRWIVPLDRKVDYLTLSSGMKFQVPFELMVVFSTNLDPNELADEAFLRRIQNKIQVETITPEIFDRICYRIIESKKVPYEPGYVECVRELCTRFGSGLLRACYPADIYKTIAAISEYDGRPVYLTKAHAIRAVDLYFAKPQAIKE